MRKMFEQAQITFRILILVFFVVELDKSLLVALSLVNVEHPFVVVFRRMKELSQIKKPQGDVSQMAERAEQVRFDGD